MKEPLVSIIIPVYNAADHLVRCLERVTGQTYHNIEILLIDDGSTDGSGDIADRWAEDDGRVRVFHQTNKGVSEARNLGLANFKGEYVAFVDADDLVDACYIERLYDALMQCRVSVSLCAVNDCGETGIQEYQCEEFAVPVKIELKKYDYTKPYAHKVVWGALYERKIVHNLRFRADIYLGEDSLFFAEVLHRCKEIAFLNEKRYMYLLYQNSLAHGFYDWKKKTEIIAAQQVRKVFEDYPKKFQSKVNAWYCCVCLRGIKGMTVYDCLELELYHYLLREARATLKDLLFSSYPVITKITSMVLCITPKFGGYIFKKLKGN